MPRKFFSIMLNDELTTFEKKRVISIEPWGEGTRITLEASHLSEEPLVYDSPEPYDSIMQAYLS